MVAEAAYEYLVISDSDVRVSPNYLRDVVRPLLQPEVGLVTCLYRGLPTGGLACGLTGAEDGVTRFGKRSGFSTSTPVRRLDVRMENHGWIYRPYRWMVKRFAPRKVIQRNVRRSWSSTELWSQRSVTNTGQGKFTLGTAFVLIDARWSRGERGSSIRNNLPIIEFIDEDCCRSIQDA